MEKIALTGIKPTGTPHVGNYLGAILPALELAEKYRAFYFIADYHALTTVRDGKQLQELTYEVAATWLALGLDHEKVTFFRQSEVPELFELQWILSCNTPKGLLNRAHAYKAAVDQNVAAEKDPDFGVNAGLFNYPVLMASDILMFGTNIVPVGLDQKQHIEIARDIAENFNNTFGDILTMPEGLIQEDLMTIPGTDGRKMSKNYNNTLPLFFPSKQLRKRVMQIQTDSKTVEEPKNPDECNVFAIYRRFATPEQIADMRARYEKGGLGYGTAKQELFELLEARFGQQREKYESLMANKAEIDSILLAGAEKARAVSRPMIHKVRQAIGARPR
ncbi:tryptophanyl-tRNA synthetase [Chloroherpeton thalassium ATCC 35110]|uniref:Tryptophan--tRNA ligase n=1 Tax=Chloroherpeton thalassium (strain ATCC 35110 / GB-78) TaxID=517418 RepID=B3QV34_CHLT3|nr:tryptophan--tRNA ligase [Chloroherpeton thalassium]ACF12988.1 tryptophanyl-tRNA synthetase [Chloroherpeton thalassium ATCC 35110]